MLLQELGEMLRAFNLLDMNPVLVQLLEGLIMTLVHDLPGLPIPARKRPPVPVGVHLPLLYIFGDVLPVGAQDVPDIHGDIIAVEGVERHVEIELDLWCCVVIQRDFGVDFCFCESECFGGEEEGHEEHGADRHEGSEGRGFR